MRALILAAGRGKRMGKLTNEIPKPLLKVGGRYLIEFSILRLKQAGIKDIIINVFYLGDQIKTALGNGKQYNVKITYSEEHEPLEVGGGIVNALPLLGNDPFIVISSDIITDYPLQNLPRYPEKLAHIVMVDNPKFNLQGDFGLRADFSKLESPDVADMHAKPTFTFGNIGVYSPEIFAHCKSGSLTWREVMFPYIEKNQVTAELYQGAWYNIGTPNDLTDAIKHTQEDINLRPLLVEHVF